MSFKKIPFVTFKDLNCHKGTKTQRFTKIFFVFLSALVALWQNLFSLPGTSVYPVPGKREIANNYLF
jgi:hypothetical protein